MLNVIINFNFDVDKNCDIKNFFFKFHFLFDKIFMNRYKHNINYNFLNFKIIIDFICQQIYINII